MTRYYAAPVPDFLTDDPHRIVGILTAAAEALGLTKHLHTQTRAWLAQVEIPNQVRVAVDIDPYSFL